MIAQIPDPTGYAAMGWLIVGLLGIAGGYLLILNIQVARKKLAAPTLPIEHPQPFIIQQADKFVLVKDFDQRVAEIETTLNREIEEQKKYVAVKFSELAKDIDRVASQVRASGDQTTTEFKQIEGRLSGLKSTAEHLSAVTANTNQQVQRLIENLPMVISTALKRHDS